MLLQDYFTLPQSIGIAGGRPSSSYYFVASQADDLFYLDPHHSKPSIPIWIADGAASRRRRGSDWTREEVDSFHSNQIRKLRLTDLDPSMLIGYLCQKEDDWTDLVARFERATKDNQEVLFHIAKRRPQWDRDRDGQARRSGQRDDDVVSLEEGPSDED